MIQLGLLNLESWAMYNLQFVPSCLNCKELQTLIDQTLLAIAQQLADSPRSTLQKLVEVALEICRAGSAGVSLLS